MVNEMSAGETSAAGSGSGSEGQTWGRVLIAGGTDWPNLGRRKAAAAAAPVAADGSSLDLVTPHILRALSNQKVAKIFAGHSACHALFLTVKGNAWVYGRNDKGQCGLPIASAPGGAAINEPSLLDRKANFSPPLDKSSRGDIVHAAIGRTHSIIVTRGGSVYSTGSNATSQLGLPKAAETAIFTRVEAAPWSKVGDPVIQVGAGLTFSLFLTASGKVYACGSMEKGQLGNGRTGEHFVSSNRMAFGEEGVPILVKALADKNIVSISCGQQHSIALDDQGFCYVWGFGGYGRLGLGHANDQYLPVLVPQFARENVHSRADSIYAGPTCTAVIDKSATFYLAGKWKSSGDGGSGQGWTTFRYMQALMGCKIRSAALGGVTLFAIADENEPGSAPHATMNISWGQNAANGELGLGEGKPKSATLPMRCEPLDGIGLLSVGAGQNTTFFLAKNQGDQFADLPRYPEAVDSADICLVCSVADKKAANGTDDEVALECEKCENPYHLSCLSPPLTDIPEGEWFCPECEAEGEEESESAEEVEGGKNGSKAALGDGKGRGRPKGSLNKATVAKLSSAQESPASTKKRKAEEASAVRGKKR